MYTDCMSTSTRLVKNTSYLTVAFVGQKLLAFVYFVIVARLVGAENVGIYTVALAVTTIFSVFIDLGTSPVLIREVAKKTYTIQSLLSNILLFKIIISLLVYGSVIVTVYLLDYSHDIIRLVYVSGFVMILDSIVLTIYSILRGQQQLKYEAVGVFINQLVIITVGLVGLLFFSTDLMVLMIAFFVGSAINCLYGFISIKKECKVDLVPRFNPVLMKSIFMLAAPFAMAGIFTRVYSYVDTLLIKGYLGAREVGWYSTAYKIPFALQFIPTAFAASIYPAMSDLYKKKSDRISNVFEKSMFYLMLIAFPVSFGIYSIADELIIQFYTAEYEPSVGILKIMIFGVLFIFLNFPLGSLLSACDKQRINTVFIGLTMLVNVCANVILIPRVGAQGAAIAFLVSHGFLFFSTFYIAYRLIDINVLFLLKKCALLAIISFCMAMVVISTKTSIGWLLSIPLGGVTYVIGVYALKIISLSEGVGLLKKIGIRI